MKDLCDQSFELELQYRHNEINKTLHLTDYYDDDHLKVEWMIESVGNSKHLVLKLEPKLSLKVDTLKLKFKFDYEAQQRIFTNGYQSWTDSHERALTEKEPVLSMLAKAFNWKYLFTKYGDYELYKPKKKAGYFHGYTYAYLRDHDQVYLMGSLNERSGFTLIEMLVPQNLITIEKDCAGVTIDKPLTMDLFFEQGQEDQVFDHYFNAMGIKKPTQAQRMGWTSWYNYYQNINESIITENLTAAKTLAKAMDVFQIDDGYQTAVGDWLSVDPKKFPLGMKVVADSIKAQGSIPGLWLAPFVAQKDAMLVKNHPEWILKDAQGQFEWAGCGWGGFYCLDLENQAVKDYIKTCFDVVLNDWGYELVKLDFLYAAALGHHTTKSRGQRMAEAMDFLRECVGDKMILGCGVPLGSAFGTVEYCRIGPDVSLDWKGPWYFEYIHREKVSTKNAILNAIGRRHLDKRAFLNDPDVFLLRNDNIKMNFAQKEVLAKVNQLFGSLLFTSDLISQYDQTQKTLYLDTTALTNKHIDSVLTIKKDCLVVHYHEANTAFMALINLSPKLEQMQHLDVAPTSIQIIKNLEGDLN